MSDTKLHTAVRYGNADAVLQALKSNCDPNQIGLFKWNPVHEASHNGERDILKLLLHYNGDVNLKDDLHGNTPLHYAAREDNSACVTVLLKGGASTDIKNNEGETCMDIATPLCMELIDEHVNSRNVDDWRGSRDTNNNPGDTTAQKLQDLPEVPKDSSIGSLHLSFEYHNNILKVRVWQICDLLLPPPQISMIESVFVRSYLIPDTTKKSTRKTEEVPVEGSSRDKRAKGQRQSAVAGIQHIFTPSCIRFDTPLLYTGLTQDVIKEHSIRLEVCMTQKQSRKPFLMAMVHMPLQAAVRRPIRERYALIPCMNYTTPNSMRVYNAKDLLVDSSSKEPLSRSNSSDSQTPKIKTESVLTFRDIPTGDVDVDNLIRNFISTTSSSDEDDIDDDDDGFGSGFEIKTIKSSGSSSVSAVTVDMTSSINTDDGNDNNDLTEIVTKEGPKSTSVSIEIDSQKIMKKKIIPNLDLLDIKPAPQCAPAEEASILASTVVEVKEEPKEHVVDMVELSGDVTIDIEPELTSDTCNVNVKTKSSETVTSSRKKKLIPDFKDINIEVSNPSPEVKEADSSCVYDDITRENETKPSSSKDSDSTTMSTQKSDSIQSVDLNSKKSCTTSVSSVPCDLEPSATPTSRPESPIWDDFDFTEDGDEAAQGKEESKSENEVTLRPKKEVTLAESIKRLSRTMTTLDNVTVVEPVLPTVMIEDFDMDDDDS